MSITSISYFRAIAIILIVAGHSYQFGAGGDSQLENIIRSLISGGTSLFVFISGFMFHYVFYPRFEYKSFLLNKYKNVLLPYLILLGLSLLIAMFVGKTAFFFEYFNTHPENILFSVEDSKLLILFKYYLTGSGVAAYWYIPFIMVMFLLSPLHYKFIHINPSLQIAVVLILLIVTLLIHRPVQNINVIQSVLYFTPVYLIGILTSIYNRQFKSLFKKYDFAFLLLAVILAWLQVEEGHNNGYYKLFLEYNGIDVSLLQKLSLCFFFFLFLSRFEETKSKLMDLIATTSFAIFFIHGWILNILKMFDKKLNIPDDSWWMYLLVVGMILVISIFSATLIKTVFSNSKKTRYLIGY